MKLLLPSDSTSFLPRMCYDSLRFLKFVIVTMLLSVPGFLLASSPCDCVDPVVIGSPGQSTDISSLNPEVFASCVAVKGQLVIDENTNLAFAFMRMDPASEILVEDNVTFTVYSSDLVACDTLWKGIRVENGGTLTFVLNTIVGAEYAIYTECFSTLNCQYNSFRRNYIGIASGSPYEASLSECIVYLKSPVVGNGFTCYGSLPKPYEGHYYAPDWPSTHGIPYHRSYAAVYLSGTIGLNIGTELDNAVYKNGIDSLRNGFIFEGSFNNTMNNTISNLVGPLNYPVNRFEDYNNVGIASYESFTEVRENEMEALRMGVYAKGRGNHIIVDNDITLQFPPSSQPYLTYGILAENTTALRADTNRITDAYYGISIARVFDYFTADSNTIMTDGIDDPTGIYCPFAILDLANQASISENSIELDNYVFGKGIRLDYCSAILMDDNDIFLKQSGSPSLHGGYGILIADGGMVSAAHNSQ